MFSELIRLVLFLSIPTLTTLFINYFCVPLLKHTAAFFLLKWRRILYLAPVVVEAVVLPETLPFYGPMLAGFLFFVDILSLLRDNTIGKPKSCSEPEGISGLRSSHVHVEPNGSYEPKSETREVLSSEMSCMVRVHGSLYLTDQDLSAEAEILSVVEDAKKRIPMYITSAKLLDSLRSTLDAELAAVREHQIKQIELAVSMVRKKLQETKIIENLESSLHRMKTAHKLKLDRLIEANKTEFNLTIRRQEESARLSEPLQCPVCYNEKIAETVMILRPCKHILCAACTAQLLFRATRDRTRAKCPYCRTHISEDVVQPNRPIQSQSDLQAYIAENF